MSRPKLEATEITESSEFGLIARHFAPLVVAIPGAMGLTDDAALIDVPVGQQLVVTMDGMVLVFISLLMIRQTL
jgi:thiamine monophosphate kinase